MLLFQYSFIILGFLLQVQGQQFTYMLKLVDNDPNTYYQGRLEVIYNGLTGTACTDHFDNVDAMVVCRQLGLQGGLAVLNGTFGPGTGPIWLDDVECTGNERFLWECVHRFNSSNCNHGQDVGVICDATNTSIPIVNPPLQACNTSEEIRIVGPSQYIGMGFVEIKRNGIWGSVCDDNWGTLNAQVVCRMLCYDFAYAGTAVNIKYAVSMVSTTFLADDVDCVGTETDIRQCRQSSTGVHNCNANFYEFASVTCREIAHLRPQVPTPSLLCSNGSMRASFVSSLDINRNITSIALSSGICGTSQQIITSTTHDIIIPYSSCGITRHVNQSHIWYTTAVAVQYTRLAFCAMIDLCYNSYVIDITCEYSRNLTISTGFTVLTQSLIYQGQGTFEIKIKFYENAFHTQLLQPIVLICGAWLWVSVELITADADLKLIVPRCYATPYQHTGSSLADCYLFDNKCGVDPTLTFHPLSPTVFGFAYTTYKFINYSSVIIHCDAWVCLKSEKNGDCDRSCWAPSSVRGKREASTRETYRITSPPITILSDGNDEDYGLRDGVLVDLGSAGSSIKPATTGVINQATTPTHAVGKDNLEQAAESKFDQAMVGGLGGQLTFKSSKAAVVCTGNYASLIGILLAAVYLSLP